MNQEDKITLLIVDGDAECREILSRVFIDNVDIVVSGSAPSGTIGLMKTRELEPDVVLLDTSLTDLSPVEFTRSLSAELPSCGIILTLKHNAPQELQVQAIKALELGAFDFIVKPERDLSAEARIKHFVRRLVVRIRAYSIKRYSRIALQLSGKQGESLQAERHPVTTIPIKRESRFGMLAVGVSTGGPKALFALVPRLPAGFPLPVVIVIHLPGFFTASLASELNKVSPLTVQEASEGDQPLAGYVYLARGGQHLRIQRAEDGRARFLYTDEAPVNNCRPAADVLFASVAESFGDRAIGLSMTGMGNDGAEGIRCLKQRGALTLAQDRETSIVWGMPGAAVNTGCVDEIVSLDNLAARLVELI